MTEIENLRKYLMSAWEKVRIFWKKKYHEIVVSMGMVFTFLSIGMFFYVRKGYIFRENSRIMFETMELLKEKKYEEAMDRIQSATLTGKQTIPLLMLKRKILHGLKRSVSAMDSELLEIIPKSMEYGAYGNLISDMFMYYKLGEFAAKKDINTMFNYLGHYSLDDGLLLHHLEFLFAFCEAYRGNYSNARLFIERQINRGMLSTPKSYTILGRIFHLMEK